MIIKPAVKNSLMKKSSHQAKDTIMPASTDVAINFNLSSIYFSSFFLELKKDEELESRLKLNIGRNEL